MTAQKDTKYLIPILVLDILGMFIIYWGLRPGIPDFSAIEAGPERKEAFFNYLLPLIEQRNEEILEVRQQLLAWNEDRENLTWWNAWQVESLAEDYGIADFDIENDADWKILLRRVDVVPPSLALAQAANESAWGTSRFAREGNNFYGEWCFVKGCGIVPGRRDEGEYHEVADFDSPETSVESYIHNLNNHYAYKALRELRAELRAEDNPITGIVLADGLNSYSDRGEEYIKELRSMIMFNSLSQYDVDYYDY